MNLFITGGNGQLGSELKRQLQLGSSVLGSIPPEYRDATLLAPTHRELDICDEASVKKAIRCFHPGIVVHCAAITDVNGSESYPELVKKVNGQAVRYIAEACDQVGAKLVYISTDYVFSGEKGTPYREDDVCDPRTAYGKGKLLGELNAVRYCQRTFVVRSAWLYSRYRNNFVKTILNKSKGTDEIKVVNDQYGNPTNAEDLVWHLLKLAATDQYGTYHCTGKGICSWFDFAQAIVEEAGIDCRVLPCTSKDYPQAAIRPAYSALDHSRLEAAIGDEMRPWREALKDFIHSYSIMEEEK